MMIAATVATTTMAIAVTAGAAIAGRTAIMIVHVITTGIVVPAITVRDIITATVANGAPVTGTTAGTTVVTGALVLT